MAAGTPIAKHGFALHKRVFRNDLCLQYPGYLPTECVCGKQFTVDYALSCPCGRFPLLCHNEIRDITADREICHYISTEPSRQLQPLSGESLTLRSINIPDGDRVDMKAQFLEDLRQSVFYTFLIL